MTFPESHFHDIGRFIRARRMAVVASESPNLPKRRRHVPYMTQDELAELVDVSTVVISQIEQGRYPNLNASILKRISRVLKFTQQQEMFSMGLLDEDTSEQTSTVVAPQWMLDSVADTQHPVVVMSPAYDLLGWSAKTEEMFGDYADALFSRKNAMVSIFDVPELRTFFADWNEYATSVVSGLRMSYSVHAYLRDYIIELAEDLSERHEFFHFQWIKDDPLVVPTIEKELEHSTLGRLRMIQVITIVVEAPNITMVEFLPADDETQAKLAIAQDEPHLP